MDTTVGSTASAGREARATSSPRRTPDAMTLGLARFLSRGEGNLGHAGAVQPYPGVLRERVLVRVRERLVRGDAVLVAAGHLVALLVRDELLDRVGLLRVGNHPVPDALPRRVRIAAEHQLSDRGGHLEKLGASRVGTVCWMDLDAGGDLHLAVHDHGFTGQDLSVDLVEGLGRIAAGGSPRAAAGRR